MTIPIGKVRIKNALTVYEIIKKVLHRENMLDQNKEHLWVMALNSADKILNLELVAFGSGNRLKSRPADILAIPLQKQAKGVILAHNNPSGSIMPSEEDKDFTDKMIKACKLVNTPVLDYVIVTEHSYFSFNETGLLDRLEESTKYLLSYELERQLKEELQEAIRDIEQEGKIKIKMAFKDGKKEGKADGLVEGEKKGRNKGIKEGREKGIQKGIKEGIQQEKLEIAKQMLKDGESIEKIKKWTGLSKQELEKIQEGSIF